LRRPVS